MKRYPGKKISTAVFISGRGSNLKNLIKFSLKKRSPIEIKLVISDNSKAKGLVYPKKYKIDYKIYNFKRKYTAENNIIKVLKKKKNKTYLSCWFYENFNKKIYPKI